MLLYADDVFLTKESSRGIQQLNYSAARNLLVFPSRFWLATWIAVSKWNRKADTSFFLQVRSHFQEAAAAGPPPQKDQWYTRTPGAVSFVYPVAHNN